MKIDLGSDIHAEFSPWVPKKTSDDVETLILAGDIILIKDFPKFSKFFDDVSSLYKNVIYVCGNHEFYRGDFITSLSDLRNYLRHLTNIHILEKQSVEIEDVVFIGGTMWTDANKENPLTMLEISCCMNDYRIIQNGTDRLLNVEDTIKDHKEFLKYLRTELGKNKDKKCVIVTHHAPSFACINERYKHDYHMNGAYASDLDQFILDRPQIKVWVSGHTHSAFDFHRGSSRLMCNPRGYVNYERLEDDLEPYLPKMFEV